MTIPAPSGRFVIECPNALSERSAEVIRDRLIEWQNTPGRPLLLMEGARLRHVRADGTITPADYGARPPVLLPWWAMALGAFLGAVGTLAVQSVLA